jgi:hypothetical protein
MPAAITDEKELAPVAEPETGPRRFRTCEDMTIAYHPEWEYLTNATLAVRPPTEEEAAALAARATDPDFIDLYQPAEPHIILPPSPEVAALTEAAAAPDEAEAEPGEDAEPVVLDPRLGAALDDADEAHLAAFHQLHDAQDAREAIDAQDVEETRTFTAAIARIEPDPDE